MQFASDDFSNPVVGLQDDGGSTISGSKSYLGSEEQLVCYNSCGMCQNMKAETIVAHILSSLRETAQNFVSKRLEFKDRLVEGVVLGVPANFSEAQKVDLVKAAKLAGFEEVNEILQ